VDRAAHLVAEDVVDEAVLLDAALAGKGGRGHGGVEVVAAAVEVYDLGLRLRYRGLDPLLEILCRGHAPDRLAAPGMGATLPEVITLTDKGAEKVHEFLDKQQSPVDTAGLRVGVRGGGCSGFQYALAFDVQRDDDTVFESQGIKLLVDTQSLAYVTGAVVDYVDGLQGAGFQVNNPNVIASCGCGSSFRVRDEEEVSAV
jgi:iron-sulfur cluster assembly protein